MTLMSLAIMASFHCGLHLVDSALCCMVFSMLGVLVTVISLAIMASFH